MFREVSKIYGDVRRDNYYYNLKSFIQPDEPVVKEVARILSNSADPIATAQDFIHSRTKYHIQKGEMWKLPVETLDARVGDCISGDTPVWVRCYGTPRLIEARELIPVGDYVQFGEMEILTPTGFAPLISVRRKKVRQTVRLLTTSDIELTPEHKLLVNPNLHDIGRYCEAQSIRQGQILRFYPELGSNGGDYELGWALGLFFSDGSCGFRKSSPQWRMVNTNTEYLERAAATFSRIYPDFIFPIRLFPSYSKGTLVDSSTFTSLRNHDTYCMDLLLKHHSTNGYHNTFVRMFREIMYNPCKVKRVPDFVLNGSTEMARGFWDGACAGDGEKGCRNPRITKKGKLPSAGLAAVIHKLGKIPSMIPDNNGAIRINPVKSLQDRKQWRHINNFREVFDITTGTGELIAGDIAIKNCDCTAILLCSLLRSYLSPDEVFVAVGNIDNGGHAWVMTRDKLIESTAGSDKKFNENRYSVEVLFNDKYAFVDTSLPDEFGFLFVSGRYNVRVE